MYLHDLKWPPLPLLVSRWPQLTLYLQHSIEINYHTIISFGYRYLSNCLMYCACAAHLTCTDQQPSSSLVVILLQTRHLSLWEQGRRYQASGEGETGAQDTVTQTDHRSVAGMLSPGPYQWFCYSDSIVLNREVNLKYNLSLWDI